MWDGEAREDDEGFIHSELVSIACLWALVSLGPGWLTQRRREVVCCVVLS